MAFVELLLIGVLAGTLGAMLGLGGGIFLVPALTLLLHVEMRLAVATSLVAVIATSAGVAAVTRRGRGADVGLALRLSATTSAAAIAGSFLAERVSGAALSLLFAGVVLGTAAYLWRKSRREARLPSSEDLFREDYQPRRWPVGLAASGLAGLMSGLLGVGGGFLQVPLMYAVMEIPLGVATATSNFMVGITAAASVFVYYGRGDVRPMLVVPTVVGVFIGAMLGVSLARRARVSWLRTALIGLLVLMGVQMLLHGLRGGGR